MRTYTLIWTDERGRHSCDYTDLDILLGEIEQCLRIDIKHKELYNYKIEVREV